MLEVEKARPAEDGWGSILPPSTGHPRASLAWMPIRYEEAIAAFDKSIELNPGFVSAYLRRGDAFAGEYLTPETLKESNKQWQATQ